jgi:hypothetical protein
MPQVSKKWTTIFSYWMIGLILFSSVGVVMDYHLCRGEIKKVGFFAKAEVCERTMEAQKGKDKPKACCALPDNFVKKITIPDFFSKGKSPSYSDKPCCTHEQEYFQMDVEASWEMDPAPAQKLVDFWNHFAFSHWPRVASTSYTPLVKCNIPPWPKQYLFLLFEALLL